MLNICLIYHFILCQIGILLFIFGSGMMFDRVNFEDAFQKMFFLIVLNFLFLHNLITDG